MKEGFKESTELIAFLAKASDDFHKAMQDGKITVKEAIGIVLSNAAGGLSAFNGAEKIPAELLDAQPEEIDAGYQAFLDKRGWNNEPRTGFRDIFNEGILTLRQLLKFGRLVQHTMHPPKAPVVADPIADPQ